MAVLVLVLFVFVAACSELSDEELDEAVLVILFPVEGVVASGACVVAPPAGCNKEESDSESPVSRAKMCLGSETSSSELMEPSEILDTLETLDDANESSLEESCNEEEPPSSFRLEGVSSRLWKPESESDFVCCSSNELPSESRPPDDLSRSSPLSLSRRLRS